MSISESSENLFNVEFTPSLEDVKSWYIFSQKNRQKDLGRRGLGRFFLGISKLDLILSSVTLIIIGSLIFWYLLGYFQDFLLSIFISFLCVILLSIIAIIGSSYQKRKNYTAVSQMLFNKQKVISMFFIDHLLFGTLDSKKGKYFYSDLSLAENKKYVFLLTNPSQASRAIILPKKYFTDEQIKFIKSKINRKSNI